MVATAADSGENAFLTLGRLTSDASGRIALTWYEQLGVSSAGHCSAGHAVLRDSAGVWHDLAHFVGAVQQPVRFNQVQLSPSGHALVLWSRHDGMTCAVEGTYVSWFVPGRGWQQPIELLPQSKYPSWHSWSLSLAPNGRALAAWEKDGMVLTRWLDPP